MKRDKTIYSLNVADVQNVSEQILQRLLTDNEIVSVQELVGDYVDWFQAVESAIRSRVCA